MSGLQFPEKDPNEVLDYQVDWTAKLSQGETISTSQFIVDGGVTVQSSSNTSSTTTVWLTGGTEGATANILNRITTSGGRTMDETVLLPIRSK
jgi:hypothetical protein